jgi:hypothetical protein
MILEMVGLVAQEVKENKKNVSKY